MKKQRCCQQQPYHSESCSFALHVEVPSLSLSCACLPVLARLSRLSLNILSNVSRHGSSVSPKIPFEPVVCLVRPGIPEVEGGDGVPVGFKRGKGQNVWFERRSPRWKMLYHRGTMCGCWNRTDASKSWRFCWASAGRSGTWRLSHRVGSASPLLQVLIFSRLLYFYFCCLYPFSS